jgi:hypothetical protein
MGKARLPPHELEQLQRLRDKVLAAQVTCKVDPGTDATVDAARALTTLGEAAHRFKAWRRIYKEWVRHRTWDKVAKNYAPPYPCVIEWVNEQEKLAA